MEGVVDGVRSTPQRQRRLAKVIVLRNMEDELQGERECLKATHSPPTLLDSPQSRKAPPTHCRVLVGVAFALRFQLRKPHKHPAPQVENIAQETYIPPDLHDAI